MSKGKNHKLNYATPLAKTTCIAFEQALLVGTARLLLQVDELQNVNAETTGADQPGGEMYFEY